MDFPGIRKMTEMAQGMSDVISFALGEPDFDTPQHIKDAAVEALKQGYTRYTSNYGLIELREAISRKLKAEYGIDGEPGSEILVTAGAQQAVYTACQAFVDPGDEVLITDPCYHSYPRMIKLAEGVPVPVRLSEDRDFSLDGDKLKEKITPRTKMIVLNSPQNPTGAIISYSDLEDIAEVAIEHDFVVVSDEVYDKILYDDFQHRSIASIPEMRDRTITINGFSKTYAMTGWRIGYCAANSRLIKELVKIQAYSVTNANSVAQKAAVAALEGPQDCVREMVREFKRRRNFVIRRLSEIDGVRCRVPKGTFYVFPDTSRIKKPSTELAEYLLKESRIVTVPGAEYGASGEYHLRLSFATSMEKLSAGLDRFEEGLARANN